MPAPNTKLAIFPASGGLGGATLQHLLKAQTTTNPKDVILIARSPERLSSYAQAGVEVRKADYDQADTLVHAFDGVKTLNLISYASIQHEHRFNVSPRVISVFHLFLSLLAGS
jgi:uncharacterized protein YbjT (DUF2867 family)